MNILLDASDFAQIADFWSQAPDITREELLRAVTEADATLQAELMEQLPKGAAGLGGGAGLAGSIKTEETADAASVIGVVSPGQPYAEWVELGTKPHKVSPLGVQSIADWVQAKFTEKDEEAAMDMAHAIAWKIVHHGTKPNPVWQRTFAAQQAKIRELFQAALVRIGQRLGGAPA